MNSKRLWMITATIFSLFAFGPRSFGVWAQEQAACRATPPPPVTSTVRGFSARAAGWEWVRFI